MSKPQTLKQAITTGVYWGIGICFPLGILSAVLMVNLLPEETAAAPVFYGGLVVLVWIAWGAFIGGMLKAQQEKDPR